MLIPRLVYSAGEDIFIRLILKNPARVPVTVPEECLTADPFRVVRFTDRAELKRSRKRLPLKALTLSGGEEKRIDIRLDELYRDVRKTGRYGLAWECGEWASPSYVIVRAAPYDREKDRVAVVTTDLGTLELVLMPEQAPEHVRNFVALARAGFYDGMPFNNIIPGVQAEIGDRWGDGTGGWNQVLGGEIDKSIRPGKGLVGAARRETSVTSASMIFILLEANAAYAGKQTFFAYVRNGLEVLDALSAVPTASVRGFGGRPIEPVAIRKIEIKSP